MNILFINSIAKHKFGGGERWMIKAARGLLDKGHAVTLASKTGARILDEAKKAGIPTIALSIHADISPLATFRIFRYLKKNSIDVLICNLNKDIRVAGLAARFAKTPLVLHRHGVGLCGKKWKHKVTLTHLTDGIITNTESIKQMYLGYGWFEEHFIKVIYNGIEKKEGITPYDYTALFPGKRIIFSAGRLAQEKGFDDLVMAAKQLRSRRSDFAVVIAGEGKLEASLKALVKRQGLENTVRFIGYVSPVDPYTAGCDIFVLPSRWEGMPNAVMEAMALGVPIVATSVNGVNELMIANETGLIVPHSDVNALAGALEKLLDDTALGIKLSEAARDRVERCFSYRTMIDNLETFLKMRLDEKRPR
jgi:glycosyltransferase involved in cell wall biosynthesis